MAEIKEPETFLTIAHNGEGRLTEKMSRFLSFARSITSAQEAREIVKEFANSYHDARHVCWAYMLGPQRDEYLSNDNGEPSGTAGKPILGQINSLNLTNVIVLVVRYFGGIKLGTPGLIAAYRQAARLALDDAGIKEITRTSTAVFEIPYQSMNFVMRIIKEKQLKILSQLIDTNCVFEIEIPLSIRDEVLSRLGNIDNLIFK